MADSPATRELSPSAQAALSWAGVVARVRSAGGTSPEADASDLFLGALLSHLDDDGEVPVLLAHLGLTARDLVGDAYARVSPGALAAAAGSSSEKAAGSEVDEVLSRLQTSATYPRLAHLVGAVLSTPSAFTERLEQVLTAVGDSSAALVATYEQWLEVEYASGTGAGGVAGRSLRAWLEVHHPRGAVDVAGFSSDGVEDQPDLVGIDTEADALAYLVASRDLVPPLAVGLFGDWGSGKSFLMRTVEERVRDLGRRTTELGLEQHEASVWRQIRSIRFNAWEYVQGDLWAGLLERIFAELGDRAPEVSLVAARRSPLEDERDRHEAEASGARLRAQALRQEQVRAAQEIRAARAALEGVSATAGEREAEVLETLRAETERAVAQVWGETRVGTVQGDLAGLSSALQQAVEDLRRGRALLGPYWRHWRHLALVGAVALVVPVVSFLLQSVLGLPAVTAALGALAAAVPVATAWLRAFSTWTERTLAVVEEAERKVRAAVDAPLVAAQQALREAHDRYLEVQRAVSQEQAVEAAETAAAAAVHAELAVLTPARIFVEFSDERSADYRRRLGPLAAVRRDLETVQRVIADNNALAAMTPEERARRDAEPPDAQLPNRIVLYVDDLDRCPASTVLQVLEAVHLLLAFPLFVVVVAVDERWLSSALTEELPALRPPPGSQVDLPTPGDYLEKIFQLPIWVRSMTPERRGRLVSGLLGPTVRTDPHQEAGGEVDGSTGAPLAWDPQGTPLLDAMLTRSSSTLRLETRALALSKDELDFVASLGPLLGETPRRVKRFVNTVQLLLSMSPPLSSAGPLSPRLVLCLLAVLHEELPTVARQLLHSDSTGTLGEAMDTPGVDPDERALLETWLAEEGKGRSVWRDVRPALVASRLDLIARTSFRRPAPAVPRA